MGLLMRLFLKSYRFDIEVSVYSNTVYIIIYIMYKYRRNNILKQLKLS